MGDCKMKERSYETRLQARSSVGERYLDAVEVGGSIPPVPTISFSLPFLMNF